MTVPSARGGYGWLCLASAVFTVYGSLVPFHFRARPAAAALDAFAWVLSNRLAVESRSDAAANVLLGVPLGFFALAAARVDRPGRLGTGLAALALLPACEAFAAAVEFAQLYFPGRTCSATDIAAQTLGSALGIAFWLLAGASVTRRLRAAWDSPRLGGTPGRAFVGYCAAVLLVQSLPLDIHTSPGDLVHRLRDARASGRATLVPFGELADPAGVAWPAWAASAAAVVALFLPAGLLLGAIPARGGVPAALAGGLALAGVSECAQLFVSRHPSATELVVGATAVAAGRAAADPVRRAGRAFRRACAKVTASGRHTTPGATS